MSVKLTKKEQHVLEAITRADFFGEGNAWPECNGGPDGYSIYSWSVVDACDHKIVSAVGAGGVIASLSKKGLVHVDHICDGDNEMRLTWEGVKALNAVSSVLTDWLKPTEHELAEPKQETVANTALGIVDEALHPCIEPEEIDHLAFITQEWATAFDGKLTVDHPNNKHIDFGGKNRVYADIDYSRRFGAEERELHIDIAWWSGKSTTTLMINALQEAAAFKQACRVFFDNINA